MLKNTENYYQGHCLNAYEIFGAHIGKERGKQGVRFTTYAPHALQIQVIGSFNDWSCIGCEMKRMDEKGIWSFCAKCKGR